MQPTALVHPGAANPRVHSYVAKTGILVFFGIASGVSLAGYSAARELDRRVTTIRVVP